MENKNSITRFSIEIRNLGRSLEDIAHDPKQLVSYFDRFKFYNFEDDDSINRLSGFQLLMSKVRREHRKSFERYKDRNLEKVINQSFLSSIDSWFKEEKREKNSFDLGKAINRQFNKIIKGICS